MELQELRENLWRWSDRGGGKTRTGKEKMKEPDKKTNDKKLKKLEEILERERQDQRKCEELRERERQETLEESEKRKNRLVVKRALESKWQTVRWVTRILEENETELEEMLLDLKESESQELKEWGKLKRFNKIEKLRQEKGFARNKEKIDGQSA